MKRMYRNTFCVATALFGAVPFAANATVVTYSSQASFLSAVTGTTMIDFNAQNTGGPNGYSYYGGSTLTIGGASFTQPEGRLFDFGQSFYSTSGLTSSYLNVNCCAASGINVVFSGNQMAVGMNLGIQNTWNSPSLNVTFTLSNGDIVNTIAPLLYGTGNSMVFFGFTTSTPFTTMNINGPSQGVAIDNFIYATSAHTVPEPASLALLGLGLLGLGFSRRTRAR